MQELTPVVVRVAAPRVYVFQCLTAFDKPSPAWERGLEPQVISDDGRSLLVRFRSGGGAKPVRTTVERVRVQAPELIVREHVEGGPDDFHDELTITPVEGGTELRLRGDVASGAWLVAPLVERLVTAPRRRRALRRRLQRYRVTIEAAARASGRSAT